MISYIERMPLVSAIIANHNYARFLPDALGSIFNQDFPEPIEIIVVDDGSTDGSRDVLKRYGGKIRAVFQENQGQAVAFNNGIGLARGDILCLLDADDVWDKTKVRKVVDCFSKRSGIGVVQHFLQDTDARLTPTPVHLPDWPDTTTIDDFLDGRAHLASTSGSSFRRKTALSALPIPGDLRFNADEYLTISALFHSPAANIAEVLGLHRVHSANNYAGVYSDPRRIVNDFKMRRVLRKGLRNLLEIHGKTLSKRFESLDRLEYMRREILYHAHQGHRLRAMRAWRKGLAAFARDRVGFFRLTTCALAVVSARLYLRLYSFYCRLRLKKP